jgi:hypothetical protein
MGKVGGLVAAGLLLSTAGCVEAMNSGYPTTYGYGYGNPGYYNGGGYYSNSYYYNQPAYYRPAPVNNYYTTYAPPPRPIVVTQTRYVPVPAPTPAHRMGDRDHDGIPDRYDRDKNGDGIPDRWQRR